MASAYGSGVWRRAGARVPAPRSLGRRMTIHAAAALIAFAVMQIWLVSEAISRGSSSALLLVALVLVAVLAVPVAQTMERRWDELSRQALASSGLYDRFRRDVRRLWAAALCVPLMWVSGFALAGDAIAAIIR
jgi:hypothetical protein